MLNACAKQIVSPLRTRAGGGVLQCVFFRVRPCNSELSKLILNEAEMGFLIGVASASEVLRKFKYKGSPEEAGVCCFRIENLP